jgi:hypothetical protein
MTNKYRFVISLIRLGSARIKESGQACLTWRVTFAAVSVISAGAFPNYES